MEMEKEEKEGETEKEGEMEKEKIFSLVGNCSFFEHNHDPLFLFSTIVCCEKSNKFRETLLWLEKEKET